MINSRLFEVGSIPAQSASSFMPKRHGRVVLRRVMRGGTAIVDATGLQPFRVRRRLGCSLVVVKSFATITGSPLTMRTTHALVGFPNEICRHDA